MRRFRVHTHLLFNYSRDTVESKKAEQEGQGFGSAWRALILVLKIDEVG